MARPGDDDEAAGLRRLTARFPRPGRLQAIVLRPARGLPAVAVAQAQALVQRGLQVDRASDRAPRPGAAGGKRQVTLVQAEHLPLIAAWTGHAQIEATTLRRNLVVSGLNLLSARSLFADHPLVLRIGAQELLQLTGPCDPCSKMEAELGPGAYNAMRGHGGLTSRVLAGGCIMVGDEVVVGPPPAEDADA